MRRPCSCRSVRGETARRDGNTDAIRTRIVPLSRRAQVPLRPEATQQVPAPARDSTLVPYRHRPRRIAGYAPFPDQNQPLPGIDTARPQDRIYALHFNATGHFPGAHPGFVSLLVLTLLAFDPVSAAEGSATLDGVLNWSLLDVVREPIIAPHGGTWHVMLSVMFHPHDVIAGLP
ncbi:hypothetical protein DTO271D3_3130 [Paecilomyces variotii]|nr:hypothetical protein DTO271D3_3130 [Paecilomyces variotii]